MRRGYIRIPKRYRRNLNNYIGFGLGGASKMTVEESVRYGWESNKEGDKVEKSKK